MINYKKLRNLLIWKCKTKNVGSSQLPTATRMADLNGEFQLFKVTILLKYENIFFC